MFINGSLSFSSHKKTSFEVYILCILKDTLPFLSVLFVKSHCYWTCTVASASESGSLKRRTHSALSSSRLVSRLPSTVRPMLVTWCLNGQQLEHSHYSHSTVQILIFEQKGYMIQCIFMLKRDLYVTPIKIKLLKCYYLSLTD